MQNIMSVCPTKYFKIYRSKNCKLWPADCAVLAPLDVHACVQAQGHHYSSGNPFSNAPTDGTQNML